MKNIFLFILIFIFAFLKCFSHDNLYVHQKIMIEAYNLLKIQLSKEANGIADLNTYIGGIDDDGHNCNQWYECGSLTGGADQEDVTNLVYDIWKIIEGDCPLFAHFWDVDNYWKDELYIWDGHYKTLYTKSKKYMNDDYTKIIYDGVNNGHCKHWCNKVPGIVLSDYYWKNSIYVNYSHEIYWFSCGIPAKKKKNYDWPWGQTKSRKMFFNLVGRVCHLLTDCGVPEHIRGSYHAEDWSAPFETWLEKNHSEFYWTADKVYNERGGFVNPFCVFDNDPNLFLYYTTAQISDWFFNYGHFPKDGNSNYNSNVGEIHSIIQSYAPFDEIDLRETIDFERPGRDWGDREMQWELGQQFQTEQFRQMRDVLLPYTIRAVAGLLYKYIIEAKMQDQYSTEFNIGSVYDQQQELNLFNQDINGDYYTFRAEGTPGRITVCPETRPSGYPADFVIGSTARNVTFRAAKEIIFKPGFVANQGAQVHAYLNCNCDRNNQPGNCKECLDEDYNPQYNRSIEQ